MRTVERDNHIYNNEFEPRFYIYILRDRQTLEVRYVGQSCNPYARFKAHIAGKTDEFRQWLDDLAAKGSGVEMRVVAYVQPGAEYDTESEWIKHYIECGHDLLNKFQRPK